MGCFINDVGIVCSAGIGQQDFYQNLLRPGDSYFTEVEGLSSGRRRFVAEVKAEQDDFPPHMRHHYSRTNQHVFSALLQIRETLDDVLMRYPSHRIGVIMGTCTSGSTEIDRSRAFEIANGRIPEGYRYDVEFMDNVADFVRGYLNIAGPSLSVSTACTSSGKAIAMAKRYLDANLLDAVIVGGADSYSKATLNGFDSLASLSEGICLPFGKYRDGINLGEGAAIFVISRDPSEIQLLGAGESSDAYHMSAPDPTAKGPEIAIRFALEMAGVEPDDIGYINLHGTATRANDDMESILVNRVFGDRVPCSSTKNLTGHTLGAASSLELAACVSVLKQNTGEYPVIAQHGNYEIDPALPPINLAGPDVTTRKPVFLSTSYAFGGSNTCLVVAKKDYKYVV